MEKDGELAALAERYLELVYRVALNCVGHPADADDVTQNVMVRFLRACPELESPEHARRWFIRVAVNESRRLLTAPWRRRTVSLEELSAILPAGREEQAELLEAVLSLPRLYRLPLYLYYYDGVLSGGGGGAVGAQALHCTDPAGQGPGAVAQKIDRGVEEGRAWSSGVR